MQSMAQLCGLAFEMCGEDWDEPEPLPIDEDALSLATRCGLLLANTPDAISSHGPLPTTESGPGLHLMLMRGLLASARLMLKAQQRLACLGQRSGVCLHLMSLSKVMTCLAEVAHAHWQQQPGSGGASSLPATQPYHEPRGREEELLLADLYRAAYRAVCITQTFPAYSDDLPNIHLAAATIIFQLLSESIPLMFDK